MDNNWIIGEEIDLPTSIIELREGRKRAKAERKEKARLARLDKLEIELELVKGRCNEDFRGFSDNDCRVRGI